MRRALVKYFERRIKTRTGIGILLSLLLLAMSLFTVVTLQHSGTRAASVQTLPGEQVWPQGVSSLLFGANDASWQWSPNNLGNDPKIQAAVRTAGITVIRTPLSAGDALARVSAIEAVGAKCLGILSPTDALQVVQMLGSRCDMYEWMNEPDHNGPTASAYASSWNQNIPQLRKINPHAIFIGPVVASPHAAYIEQFLTLAKQAGNIPDAVSFHMYPCTDQTIATCPAQIGDYARAASLVQTSVKAVLGYTLPLALTEWNYSWKPNQTPQNDPFIKTFTALSLAAMAKAGIVMANQYDIGSNAGGGSLDMINLQNSQALPQLDAMGEAIQQYQHPQIAPVAPTATSTPAEPLHAVIESVPQGGLFVLGQPLHCAAGAPTNSQMNVTSPPATSNLLAPFGITDGGCSLIFKVQQSQQTLRLNWWNTGAGISAALKFQVSTSNTGSPYSSWTPFPAIAKGTVGGTQLMAFQNATWVKVGINPPSSHATPVDLVMELYSLNDMSGMTIVPPQAILLPRH